MINSPAQVAENFAAAWNKANADEIAELFSVDADFVNVVGLWWNSRKQIRDAHAYGFDRMFPDTVMTLNKVTTRLLGVDVAVVHAAWTMEGQITPQGERAGVRTGVFSFTLSRQDDASWICVSAHNTDKVPGKQTHIASADTLTPASYVRKLPRKHPPENSHES